MEGLTVKRRRCIGAYILGRTIGEGTTAKVKLGRNKQTQERVAIKVLSKDVINLNSIEKEISICCDLRHSNIVEIKEIIRSKDRIFIVMEYVAGGDLFGKILREGPLNEKAAKRVFQQLLNAVHHCHQKGIFHRDLKLENVLLTGTGDVKLSDFGLAAFIKTVMGENQFFNNVCGTPNYLPPEALEPQSQQSGYSGAPVDIWSLGVVLYVILVGQLPFLDRSFSKLCIKIKHAEYRIPEGLSNEVKDLLKRILCPDPMKRITIDEIKQHPWITNQTVVPLTDNKVMSLLTQNPVLETANDKPKRIRVTKCRNSIQNYEPGGGLTLSSLFEERTNHV
eukprot:g5561.t1